MHEETRSNQLARYWAMRAAFSLLRTWCSWCKSTSCFHFRPVREQSASGQTQKQLAMWSRFSLRLAKDNLQKNRSHSRGLDRPLCIFLQWSLRLNLSLKFLSQGWWSCLGGVWGQEKAWRRVGRQYSRPGRPLPPSWMISVASSGFPRGGKTARRRTREGLPRRHQRSQ